jgi:hypothetical protein
VSLRPTLALLVLLACPLALGAEAGRIHIVLSDRTELYTSLADSLEAGLKRDPAGRRLRLTRTTANPYARVGEAALTVAVGMRGCQAAVDAREPQPLLCVLVPKSGVDRLAERASSARFSAIYLDQPLERQLALARALLPDASRAGLLAGPELRRQSGTIWRRAGAMGFRAELGAANNEDDAARELQRLVRRNDLILAVYDPQVLTPTTAKWLLHLAYQNRLPVIGFSRAYVDAGAVAAVYSTPEHIGRQAAEAILAWAQDGRGRLAPSAHPRYFDIAVNRAVADALGLKPPPESELAKQVARLAGETP